MATIEPYVLADGKTKRYRVRYRTPDKRSTDKGGFARVKDAKDFAATVEVSMMRGEYVAPADARATIGQLGPRWLGRQTHLKPSALRPVEIAWRVHVAPRWSAVAVSDVRHTDVQQWVSDLSAKRGATTVIRAFGVLAAILDDAVSDRRTLTNPARGVKVPRKVKAEHRYLTHQQVADLAAAAGVNGPMVLVLAYCGLRWGEAAGLRVRDLDLLRRRISVVQNAVEVGSQVIVGTPKNHKRRTVPVPAFVVDQLARRCEGKDREDLLFPGPGGFMRPPRGTGGWFANAVARSGVPRITPHSLRHTAASLGVSSGASVKSIQRMLGHASAAMTLDVYADLFDDDLDAVGVALDHAATSSSVGFLWVKPTKARDA